MIFEERRDGEPGAGHVETKRVDLREDDETGEGAAVLFAGREAQTEGPGAVVPRTSGQVRNIL